MNNTKDLFIAFLDSITNTLTGDKVYYFIANELKKFVTENSVPRDDCNTCDRVQPTACEGCDKDYMNLLGKLNDTASKLDEATACLDDIVCVNSKLHNEIEDLKQVNKNLLNKCNKPLRSYYVWATNLERLDKDSMFYAKSSLVNRKVITKAAADEFFNGHCICLDECDVIDTIQEFYEFSICTQLNRV